MALKTNNDKVKKEQKIIPKIKVTKNGPYIIYGWLPIQEQIIIADSHGTATSWQHGALYPPKGIYTVCRCGESKNKPFCDGTHMKVNFDGSESSGEEIYLSKPKEIDGPTLKLLDIENLCASARFCHRAKGIWSLVPASGNPVKKRIAIEETCDCPSGRLILEDKRTGTAVEPNFKKSIGLIEDPAMGVSGPVWVRGGVPVESAAGRIYRIRNRVTLCRCGKSKNKPFCDSSHYPEAEDVEKVHNK